MAWKSVQDAAGEAWALARAQHWVITRRQLLAMGYTSRAIEIRIAKGRLHRVHAGVYAVGRASLAREGHFAAAVLACDDGAALSDHSAAEHWCMLLGPFAPIHVSVPAASRGARPGIRVHRRTAFEVTRHMGIRVTTAACTIVQLASSSMSDGRLERAMNEAVNRDLTDPDRLRETVAGMPHRRGAPRVLSILDRDTYAVTDSRLEQRLLRIVRAAGLPKPATQVRREGGRVDFYWPDLGLVVEADSLRFHRTPAQQLADRLRDQAHAAAGLVTLRFTHWQICFDADHVAATLVAVIRRLAG
jgi:very-short-patch-repair endonuclease